MQGYRISWSTYRHNRVKLLTLSYPLGKVTEEATVGCVGVVNIAEDNHGLQNLDVD
jgi:hypothetical protein